MDVTPSFGWVIRVLTDDNLAEEDLSEHASGNLSERYPMLRHYIVKLQGPLTPKKKSAHMHLVAFSEDYKTATLISPDGKESKIYLREGTFSKSIMHDVMYGMITMKPASNCQ